MERIVYMPDGSGVRLEGHVVPDAWEVSSWRQNGVLERSARSVMHWKETGTAPPRMTPDERRAYICENFFGAARVRRLEEYEQELEEVRLRNLKRSARRAKTQCRRAIIAERFDEMLTLTYRESQLDRDLCQKHFAAWCRRMRKALGGVFRYCAALEPQERGSMHVHCATHKLPAMADYKGSKVKAWQIGTRIWRDIVGADNGLCFVGGRSKFGAPRAARMSLAKMGAYVSKYILKDCENLESGAHRYHRSLGVPIAKPERMTFYGCTLLDLMNLVYEEPSGTVVHTFRLSKWRDSLWFNTETPPILPS